MSALSVFALRLAAGMTACLLLLSPSQVNPRFYRVHFLTALGLAGLAALFAPTAGSWLMWTLLAAGAAFALAGSVAWFLEKTPGGRSLIVLTLLALAGASSASKRPTPPSRRRSPWPWPISLPPPCSAPPSPPCSWATLT